jgi:hypothetical protein
MVIFKIQIEKQTALQFTNMDRMSLVSTPACFQPHFLQDQFGVYKL